MTTRLLVSNPATGDVERDLRDYVSQVQVLSGVAGSPALTGGPYQLPGRAGATFAPYQVGQRRFPVAVMFQGRASDGVTAGQQQLADQRSLGRLLHCPGEPLTLTLETDLVVGGQVLAARWVAEATMPGYGPDLSAELVSRAVLEFFLLPGYWRDENASSTPLTSGTPVTIDVDSDARTDWVQVTLTGGADPTIANSATGKTLSYSGSPASASLDVRAFTATDGGADVRSHVSSDDVVWLELAPGQNTLTLSGGGTATVAWRGVHL